MADTLASAPYRLWTPAGFRDDEWVHAENAEALSGNGRFILPLAAFLALAPEERTGLEARLGVSLAPGDRLEAIVPFLPNLPLVALMFPSFSDGRSFSKAELLRIPLWGAAARAYGLVPVEREQGARTLRAMLAAAKDRLAEGRPLVIFPEGTRVPHGHRAELRSGFAGLYKLLGLPVVPVAIDSGPCYHRTWKRPGTIHVKVGDAIPPGLPRDQVETRVHAAINVLNG